MQQRYMTVQFGSAYAGCATVGYTLKDSDAASLGERVASGIVEIPAQSGLFGAMVSLPDEFIGSVIWDTGGDVPVYAIEEVNASAAGGSGATQDPRIMSGGNGPVLWTYQLLNQDSRPIVRADVYASTDPEGQRVVAFTRTDAEGMARFRLEPGPVYLWRSRPGCVFTNPDRQTVEAA
jgi:hypothetical protein